MPNIIQFLILAALVLACLIICLALIAFRGFLITGAVLGAVGGDGWAFHGMALPNAQHHLFAHPRGGDSSLRAHLPCGHQSPQFSAFRFDSCRDRCGWLVVQ